MSPRLRALLASLGVLALALIASPAPASDIEVHGGEDRYAALAFQAGQRWRAYQRSNVPPEERMFELRRAELCNVNGDVLEPGIDVACPPPNGTVPVPACEDGPAVLPLWERTRDPIDRSWGRWTIVVGWSCPEDLLPVVGETQFRELQLAPSPVLLQPDRGWVLVNKPVIVHTDDAEQTFRIELFGFPIDVIGKPTSYTWDFGDGTRRTTASPGAPYPSHEIEHAYAATGRHAVSVTTTWEGRYRVLDDPLGRWRPVNGTAVTTGTSAPFDVVEARSRLTAP